VVSRESLSASKKQNGSLVEQVESQQAELSDKDVRCTELDGQLKHVHNVRSELCYFSAVVVLFTARYSVAGILTHDLLPARHLCCEQVLFLAASVRESVCACVCRKS